MKTILNEYDNKYYTNFAIQSTSSGNFPSRYQKADCILHLIHIEKMPEKKKNRKTFFFF